MTKTALQQAKDMAHSLEFLADILDGPYDISEDGYILPPSKFEGEPLYVAYFYEALLIGDEKDRFGDVSILEIDDKERLAFPDLSDHEYIGIYVRDDGFVCHLLGDALPVDYGGKWVVEEDEDREDEW